MHIISAVIFPYSAQILLEKAILQAEFIQA